MSSLPVNELGGLPLHPLIIHAVVVLVPLTLIGVVVMLTGGKRSNRYSPAVILVASLATLSAFAAELTGNELRQELGMSDKSHFSLGGYVPWATLIVLALVIVLAVMDRQSGGKRNTGSKIASYLALLASLGTTILVVLVGHSGATLVWG